MIIAKIIALTSLILIVYHYAIYPMLLWLWSVLRTVSKSSSDQSKESVTGKTDGWLTVTLIVAAYNEQDIIVEKLDNCLELDYPHQHLDFIFVTDGSVDNTPALIRKYIAEHPNAPVQLLHRDKRAGKSAAINRAAKHAAGDIWLFSDANAIYNADTVRKLGKRFDDDSVGAVSGQKTVYKQGIGESESLYWKYESAIKCFESEFASTTGVVGEMFAIRARCYRDIPAHIINDDAYLGMSVVRQGLRMSYEPGAICVENPSATMEDELTRRRRINAGRFQLLFDRELWPSGNWRYVWCFWSHKFLRLLLGPLQLVLLVFTALVVLTGNAGWFFYTLFTAQLTVYLLALLDGLLQADRKAAKVTRIFRFVVVTNLNTIPSLINYLKGKQTVLWDRAKRLS